MLHISPSRVAVSLAVFLVLGGLLFIFIQHSAAVPSPMENTAPSVRDVVTDTRTPANRHADQASSSHWLIYNEEITLSGVLECRVEYGPPNYGDTPDMDTRVNVPFLSLAAPIAVRRDPSDPTTEDESNVSTIQLVLKNKTLCERTGAPVFVTGKLFHAVTGHHYTPVLMDVSTLR